jgi:hypothetical protein
MTEITGAVAPDDDEPTPDAPEEVEEPPQMVKLRPHDPFSPFITPEFRGDRWARAGATEDEIEALRAEWDAAEPEDRLTEQQRIDGIADPDLARQLEERRAAEPKRPSNRAKTSAWLAYAKLRAPERADEIDGMSRADLIAAFGGE